MVVDIIVLVAGESELVVIVTVEAAGGGIEEMDVVRVLITTLEANVGVTRALEWRSWEAVR